MVRNQIFYRIISSSMYPTLDVGDVVICGRKRTDTINIGDIVVINTDFFLENNRDTLLYSKSMKDIPIIHRVIGKEKQNGTWYFKTKGDNSWRLDAASRILEKTKDYLLVEYDEAKAILVPESEIIGVVLKKIPKLEPKCPHCGNRINIKQLKCEEKEIKFIELKNPLENLKRFEIKIYFDKNDNHNENTELNYHSLNAMDS